MAATPDLYKTYTASVIAAIGPKASPRVKAAFPILIQKLHEAVILTGLTTEEWLAACDLLIEAGKVSSDKRNEMVLVTDVLGIESLVDMIEHAKYATAGVDTTSSAILGPFYRTGVPAQPNGSSIIRTPEPGADFTHLFGTVTGKDGKPLKGAIVDIWHDAPDGFYDSQSPQKPEYHCRGRFETDEAGRYAAICLKPTPYPIPYDFSAGKLLTMMDRHPFRPAHIHFYVSYPGHKTLVTQVFDRTSKYLDDDSVFAVKESLVVDFVPVSAPLPNGGEFDEPPKFELEYNIALASIDAVDASKFQG